jgi:nucleotide-binding universal stress UspA family protein
MGDTITKILVPVDFSPHAERAVHYATTLAHRLGARLELLHVVEDPFVAGAWTSDVFLPYDDDLLRNLTDGAERELAARKESARALGVTADTAVITGRPMYSILEYAREGGFDLIVMGTHGRTGLSHVFMGSVAERVVRQAPCPVLTMRAAETSAAIDTPAAA